MCQAKEGQPGAALDTDTRRRTLTASAFSGVATCVVDFPEQDKWRGLVAQLMFVPNPYRLPAVTSTR